MEGLDLGIDMGWTGCVCCVDSLEIAEQFNNLHLLPVKVCLKRSISKNEDLLFQMLSGNQEAFWRFFYPGKVFVFTGSTLL